MERSSTCRQCGTGFTWTRPASAPGRPRTICDSCRHTQTKRGRRTAAERARRRTAQCAGGCGKKLQGGYTSLPPGKRTCIECRRAGCGPVRRSVDCRTCGDKLAIHQRHYCSVECSNRRPGKQRWSSQRERQRAWEKKRRAIEAGARSEPYTKDEIGERDGWRCQLPDCQLPSRRTGGNYPDPEYPTIDHLVPLSRGGDDIKANVQIAHLYCNLSKAADRGAPEQLMLVG